MIHPKIIEKGATLGIVSPASAPKKERLQRGIEYLESQGYRVKQSPNLWGKNKYLSGYGPEQVSDLHWAFADNEIDAIFCSRGGYGTPRYLDKLDYELIAANPKMLIGYSDITALQCALNVKTDLLTISGAMVAIEMGAEEGIDPYTEEQFWNLVSQPLAGQILKNPDDIPYKVLVSGKSEGRIVGGCLSLFNNLMGTPYFPDVSGGILVLEDIGENVQHIDRMLSQFRLAGFFDSVNGIRGLVLGQFTDTWENADEDDFSLEELIRDIIGPVDFPIIANMAYGHCKHKMSIPLGAMATLDADAGTLTLQ